MERLAERDDADAETERPPAEVTAPRGRRTTVDEFIAFVRERDERREATASERLRFFEERRKSTEERLFRALERSSNDAREALELSRQVRQDELAAMARESSGDRQILRDLITHLAQK